MSTITNFEAAVASTVTPWQSFIKLFHTFARERSNNNVVLHLALEHLNERVLVLDGETSWGDEQSMRALKVQMRYMMGVMSLLQEQEGFNPSQEKEWEELQVAWQPCTEWLQSHDENRPSHIEGEELGSQHTLSIFPAGTIQQSTSDPESSASLRRGQPTMSIHSAADSVFPLDRNGGSAEEPVHDYFAGRAWYHQRLVLAMYKLNRMKQDEGPDDRSLDDFGILLMAFQELIKDRSINPFPVVAKIRTQVAIAKPIMIFGVNKKQTLWKEICSLLRETEEQLVRSYRKRYRELRASAPLNKAKPDKDSVNEGHELSESAAGGSYSIQDTETPESLCLTAEPGLSQDSGDDGSIGTNIRSIPDIPGGTNVSNLDDLDGNPTTPLNSIWKNAP